MKEQLVFSNNQGLIVPVLCKQRDIRRQLEKVINRKMSFGKCELECGIYLNRFGEVEYASQAPVFVRKVDLLGDPVFYKIERSCCYDEWSYNHENDNEN